MSSAQKILVADDSLTIRKLVESVLSREGYEVLTAVTGEECLAMAAAQKPNLILLDYILPDKQGTEICRQLINSPDTWEIPVLMMSSNGNAIRQLYQDLNNVADYLTKPFAPSVLTAVVGHLLQKEKPAPIVDLATAENPQPTPAPLPTPEPAMPSAFIDKVSRLLDLMEKKPAQEATASPDNISKPEAPAKTRSRKSRKPVASVPLNEALLRKFRLVVQKYLRPRARQIPDWETARENQDPEDFFLKRLLAQDVLSDLSSELVRATGMPAESTGALRCPVGLVPLDTILRHLNCTRATGELRVETKDEIVLACLEAGQVVFLTTNHPRNYCAGAACDFQSVPPVAIGEAVNAQEEQSLPFFLSLNTGGHLPAGAHLEELLATQGEKCLVRAFKSPDASATFFPLSKLPAMVRASRLDLPLNQLLLACYRTVDDWFTLERTISEMEATFVPTPESEEQLQQLKLNSEEKSVMEKVRLGRTIRELSESTRLRSFEVCQILFRFVKLGLIRQGLRRANDERVDDELTLIAQNREYPEASIPTTEEPKTWTETTDPAAEAPASQAPSASMPAAQNAVAEVSTSSNSTVSAFEETPAPTSTALVAVAKIPESVENACAEIPAPAPVSPTPSAGQDADSTNPNSASALEPATI
jgi:DNA-binding response OmpR family regulator